MFGPEGANNLRCGPNWVETRELGLGWLIYAFARVSKPEVVVEVGAGGSSFCILQALKDNGRGHLYTVDCWPDCLPCTKSTSATERFHEDGTPFAWEHSYFLDQIEKLEYEDVCTLTYGRGEDFCTNWNHPIDMIMIDGGHEEMETKIEWEGLAKHLKPGGYALLHDPMSAFYNVGELLENYCKKHKDFSLIIEPNLHGLGIIQRKWSVNTPYMWFATALTHVRNKQNSDTPINFTDPRKIKAIKKFNGSYFPPKESLHKTQKEMRKLANELIDSGEEQTLDKIKLVDDYLKGKDE